MQLFKASVISLGLMMSHAYAANLEIGDKDSNLGAIKASGFLRAKFQNKDYSDKDHSLKFDTAKLNLDYQSNLLTGHLEYRCYQFDKLCDFSSLVDAWLGYQINPQHQLKAGIQTLPFGPSRFWESNYFGGINTQVGIEDVHNLGINYQFKPKLGTTIDLGYFPTDAGKYHGSNGEASRYSANFIDSDQNEHTKLKEKNMWVGRVQQDIPLFDNSPLKLSLGGSYWYSDIENKSNHETGSRKTWALFSQIGYNNLNFTLTGGHNDVDNQDLQQPNQSTLGSFDDQYYVVNKGDFYTADISYKFKNVYKGLNIMPYAMYSIYTKDQYQANDSTRSVLGTSLDYKNYSFVTEYIIGKNDPLIGGSENSLASGKSNSQNHLLNLTFLYFF